MASTTHSYTDKAHLHFLSVNWCRRQDLPTPMSPNSEMRQPLPAAFFLFHSPIPRCNHHANWHLPIMMYLKMYE